MESIENSDSDTPEMSLYRKNNKKVGKNGQQRHQLQNRANWYLWSTECTMHWLQADNKILYLNRLQNDFENSVYIYLCK